MQRLLLLICLLVCIPLISSGCGDLKQAKRDIKQTTKNTKDQLKKIKQRGTVDPMVNDRFEEIRKAYIGFYEKRGRGPSNWQELRQGSSMVGGQLARIKDAKTEGYTVVWNLEIGKYLKLEDHAYVLAYDRDAPNRGGWVLLVDDTREKMSKNDFNFFKDRDAPSLK